MEWTHGKHAISGGGQLEWVQDNTTPDSTGTAPLTLAFANSQTGGFKSASSTLDTTTGSPTASLFLGAPNSATLAQYGVQEYGSRYRLFSLYGTDDYRVNSKLTVNLGLRWDIYYPYNETQNRASFLNPTAINPAVNYPGALQFAGNGTDGCNCSTPIQTYYKNIGPRLGIAYSVTPKTVVRLSYGSSSRIGRERSAPQDIAPASIRSVSRLGRRPSISAAVSRPISHRHLSTPGTGQPFPRPSRLLQRR